MLLLIVPVITAITQKSLECLHMDKNNTKGMIVIALEGPTGNDN